MRHLSRKSEFSAALTVALVLLAMYVAASLTRRHVMLTPYALQDRFPARSLHSVHAAPHAFSAPVDKNRPSRVANTSQPVGRGLSRSSKKLSWQAARESSTVQTSVAHARLKGAPTLLHSFARPPVPRAPTAARPTGPLHAGAELVARPAAATDTLEPRTFLQPSAACRSAAAKPTDTSRTAYMLTTDSSTAAPESDARSRSTLSSIRGARDTRRPSSCRAPTSADGLR
ncbi:hypothetical protein K466DRAFT_606966 [Polyporus arcularius HHB13444]|uniref:Uncharacterized protein n=1 Tax=Polyporus arcularius HHB13444 TaxID=1314778 RepID=A0A5C3NLT1_9APHY|nr:hypothetical protein K466DRAFT_606966 [Polyporus arcularius HHB13444]